MNVFTFRKKLYVALYFYINLLKIDFEEIKPDIDVQNYCNYIIKKKGKAIQKKVSTQNRLQKQQLGLMT